MTQIVGPFTVDDATPAELELVRQVAARIPAGMAARDAGGRQHLHFDPKDKPARAPSWAWGFRTNRDNVWVNRGKGAAQKRYLIAHEYAHGWEDRHGTPAMRNAVRAMMGTTLGWRNGYYKRVADAKKVTSNRPSEGFADSFARAIGVGEGVLASTYKTRVPPARYGEFLALLGGGAAAPGPFPEPDPAVAQVATAPAPSPSPSLAATHRPRRQSLSLRSWPGWSAPVLRVVPTGGRITTARGRIGSAWDLDGRRGAWWLEIVAVDGSRLEEPLWAPERALVELRPATPTRASGNQARRVRSGSAARSRRSSASVVASTPKSAPR